MANRIINLCAGSINRNLVNHIDDKVHLVNVKRFPFYAKGDGITDDTAAIQAAIDATVSSEATIYLPENTFITTGLTLYTKTKLLGTGIEKTKLKLKDGSGMDASVLKTYNFDTLVGTGSTGGVYGMLLKGFTVDGNRDNNITGGYGIAKYGYRCQLENLLVINCNADGIYSSWGGSVDVQPDGGLVEDYWDTVRVQHCGGDGIVMRGPNDSRWNNVMSYMNTGKGMDIVSVTSVCSADGLIMNTDHNYSHGDHGIRIKAICYGSNIQSESNIGQWGGPGGDGIVIEHGDVNLSEVIVYNNLTNGIVIGGSSAISSVKVSGKCWSNPNQVSLVNDGGYNKIDLISWTTGVQTVYTGTKHQATDLKIHTGGDTDYYIWMPRRLPMYTPSLPSGTGSGNAVTNQIGTPILIYQTGHVGVHVIDCWAQDTAIPGDPGVIYLQPDDRIYYATTIPSSWKWYRVT